MLTSRIARTSSAVVLSTVALGAAWGFSTPSGPGPQSNDLVTVVRVVDGDTVVVANAAGEERVRLLGVSAPEVAGDRSAAECFGAEAAAELTARLSTGATVTLVGDPSQQDRDSYGRLLRYVEAGGVDAGEALIRSGHAKHRSSQVPPARSDSYEAAEEGAVANQLGLWRACAGNR